MPIRSLDELGQPGSLYFIREKDSDGNANYSVGSDGKYHLDKTIDELKEDGSIVLTGTDVKNAQAATSQDEMKNKKNIVQLSFTKEGTEKFAAATKKQQGKRPLPSITMGNWSVYRMLKMRSKTERHRLPEA